ncbi:MAG TPA: GAF domain-containing sensor histidine kinase [Candidatus Binatia bacterium]|nr:GAF domain-containing sensor histidine kinase [Candidatus Binatia bacterium]
MSSRFAPSAGDALAKLREETSPLLAARVRAGLCLIFVSILLFGTAQLQLNRPELSAIAVIKSIQVATVVLVFWFLHRPRSWRASVAVSLFTMGEVCVTAAASGIVTRDAMSTALVFVVLLMATATLIPWGVLPQVVTVCIAAGSMLWNVYYVPIAPEIIGYPAVALMMAFVSSIYVSYEFERYRVQQRLAEEGLRASEARWKDEVHVTSALARIGQDMISSLDTPVILDRLCQRTAEALHCECSHTLLLHPDDDTFTPVASFGDTPERWETVVQTLRLPRARLGPLLKHLQREEMALVGPEGQPDLVPAELSTALDMSAGLLVALKRGREVIGIHTVGQRGAPRPFTGQQLRIARGLVQLAAMALVNSRLVEELERSSRTKSEFVSTMSHELRTPLNIILGFADMASDESFTGEERLELITRIKASGAELLDLIESTLEIGKIESGRDAVRLEPVQLAPFWSGLGAGCARLPRKNDVELHWSNDVPSISIVTDPRKLSVVIRNLVNNALKFTEHGSVRADLELDDQAVVVRVSDTGIGILPEDQESIFEAFQQADGRDTARFGGTGLGLYIVRRFVQQLGGTVTLESVRGEGSTFIIRLPRQSLVRNAA